VNLRTRHLACLFLLLSTIGAAQASASSARTGFYGHHINALLYRHAVDSRSERAAETATSIQAADPETLDLPAPCRAALRATWTMRPPAAHAAAVNAATGLARSLAL
jgi:hypothetical protein